MTFRGSHDGLPMLVMHSAPARAPVQSRMQSTRVRRSSKQEEYGRVDEKRLFERWINYWFERWIKY
jgi:hypothetical protein